MNADDTSGAAEFTYTNLGDRPPGRFLALAGKVLPGIARVQADVPGFAAAWRRDNLAALSCGDPLWVALGDSLTLGVGAPAHDRGWIGQVRERLAVGGRPHGVVNLAVSGARIADVLERQVPVLDTLRPSLVTLMIGSNDILRRRYRDGVAERYERLVRRLPPGSVVTTLPNPTRAAASVNDVLTGVAAERGLVIADLRDPRMQSWRGKLAADHFHPNERGYAMLADVVASSLGRRA